MDNLIAKWLPVLDAARIEEDSKFMVAQFCENTHHDLMSRKILNFDEEQGIGVKPSSEPDKTFIASHTIPIMVKVIKDLNIYKLVDVKPMSGPVSFIFPIVHEDPTYKQITEALTAKLFHYVPVHMGDTLSVYDVNTLANLVRSRLESFILTKIKTKLQETNCSEINWSELGGLEDWGVVVVSEGRAERILSDYEYKNDTNQSLCHAGNISDKTTILIDNASDEDYVIVGNPGKGSICYCPYLPLVMDIGKDDTGIEGINVKSRFGLLYHELEKNYKMYKVNGYA